MNRYTCPLASVSRELLKEGGGLLIPRGSLLRVSVFAVGSVLGLDAGGASAQVLGPCRVLAEQLFQVIPVPAPCPLFGKGQVADAEPALSPGRAFLYSALVPGLGQRQLGKGRWVAYLAVEGATWIAFGHARWSATNRRGQYRDLAWDVGRQFNGARVDGDFPYYEAMKNFAASGAFDTDPVAPGVQPQMDGSTFNGRAWSLATDIHFPPGVNPLPGDPEYEAALVEYQARAYDEPSGPGPGNPRLGPTIWT